MMFRRISCPGGYKSRLVRSWPCFVPKECSVAMAAAYSSTSSAGGAAAATANTFTLRETNTPIPPPSIRPSLFSSNRGTSPTDLATLPLDTYPNPLFHMSKDEVLQLTRSEYLHLTKIPYKSISEVDQFSWNLTQIVNDLIIADPRRVYHMLMGLEDERVRGRIVEGLRLFYKKDKIKLSILKLMTTDGNIHKEFVEALDHITGTEAAVPAGEGSGTLQSGSKASSASVSHLILKYLDTLAAVPKVNNHQIVLRNDYYRKLFALIPRASYGQFFSYLVNINIQPYYIPHLNSLKGALIRGSNLEKFIVRTGIRNAKWHDTHFSGIDEVHRMKMVNFYQIDELSKNAMHSIERGQVVESNLFLNLLVEKFERKCGEDAKIASSSSQKQQKRSQQPPTHARGKSHKPSPRGVESSFMEDIQTVLYVLLNHIMTFKGSQHCIKVLQYMIDNHLYVSINTLIAILRNLRTQGYFDESLVMLNNINLEGLTVNEKLKLVDEILLLISEKFAVQPKVLLGYVIAFYKDSLNSVNSLGLLEPIHEAKSGVYSLEEWTQIVQRANVDERLRDLTNKFTPTTLKTLYETVLRTSKKQARRAARDNTGRSSRQNINTSDTTTISSTTHNELETNDEESVSSLVQALFKSYITQSGTVTSTSATSDEIVTLFVKYLLKANPESPDMELTTSIVNYRIAKSIIEEFHSQTGKSKRGSHHVYMYELLIYSALTVHKDYPFAAKMIQKSRSLGLPFSFNQIYPFIMFHYSRNEFQQSERWYKEMVKHGVRAKAQPVSDVFKIAKELNWEVSGFVYKKLGIRKNRLEREEIGRISKDPFKIIEKPNKDKSEEDEDEISVELVGANEDTEASALDDPAEDIDFNLGEELSNLMYQVSQSQQKRKGQK